MIKDAAKAIDFYKKAFGAEELGRFPGPDGKSIWHAYLRIGDSPLYLSDEANAMGTQGPEALGGTPITIQLNVPDADATWKRAVSAGATVKMPLADMFWGDRYGQLADPFGFVWAISTHIKDLTPQEMAKGAEDAAKRFKK